MAAMHEKSVKAILIIDTLGKITDFRFQQWFALKSYHLIVEYPYLAANSRTPNIKEIPTNKSGTINFNTDIDPSIAPMI